MSIKNKRFTGGITIEKVTDRTKGLSIDTTDASTDYTVATPNTGVGAFTIDLPDSGSTILSDENTATVKNKTLDATNLIDGATLDNVIIVDPILDIQDITLSEMVAPSAPIAGKATLYLDSTSKELTLKDSDNNTTSFVKQAPSSANIVYGTDVSENETTIGYSASSSSDKIIQRDSNASAKIDILSDSDMAADGSDITNRNYVRRKVIVDSNDTTATEGGSLSIPTNTNSNVYYINASSNLNSYTITLPNLKGYVDYNKAYEYTFIFSTTINSLTVATSGGSSTNFFINHAEAGDAFSVVFDEDNNLWYLKDQYSRNLNNVQSEHIAVRLLDGTETTLPTGTVTVDGQSVIVEDVVLFTNLSSDPGVYRAKGTIGDNTITGWDQVSCFRSVGSPIAGDEVFVRAGTVYANTLHTYDGSSWSDTSTDKADTDLGNLTSTSINQDLLPDTTLTRDLGSSSKSWVDVWVERLLAPLGSTIAVATENATSSTNSNNVTVTSGSTVDGDSGNVAVKSGDVSGSGDSGNVSVYSGSSTGGSRGAVNLQGNGILLDSLGQGVDVDNDNIINVADPVNPQDAATKNYTDTLVENPTIEVATFDGQSSTPTNPSAGNYKVYVDDNTQKLTILDSSGNAKQIGSGSGGGINYILNPDAEVNTDGWELYSDRLSMSNVDTVGDAMDFVLNGATQGSTPAVGTRIRYMGTVANGNMSLNTDYYVSTTPLGAGTTSNPWTFGVSTTPGGSTVDITSTAGLNNSDFYPYAPLMGYGNLAYPDITWTRVTSSPMSGDAMFRLSKPASNCLGQGVAYAFTIDKADQGSVLTIGAKYNISSGTFTTGDITVYIYDITNKTIIQPSGFQVEAVGSSVYASINATFQSASNSTSYRLIFHVSSTSASAYAVDFDRISVSPQVVPLGAPVTDLVAYSPTFNATTGHSASNGWWYRIGDELTMGGSISFNGTGAASTFTVSLPPGLAIDTAKLNDSTAGSLRNGVGTWRWYDDAGGLSINPQWIRVGSSTSLSFVDGSNTVISNIFANNDRISWQATVPIVGWSSSTVVSSSADTRVVAATMTRNVAAFSASSAITSWNTTVQDTHGMVNLANGSFTVKVPGTYQVVLWSNYSTANAIVCGPRVNGVGMSIWTNDSTTFYKSISVTIPNLKAGDVVDFVAGSGSPPNALFRASINLLQGPSQIAREEIITMLCYKNTGSHTNSGGLQDVASWNAVTKDSHGGFNTTTGIYTVPAPGDYMVTFTLGFGSTSGARQGVVLKGSTIVAYGVLVPSGDQSTNPPITIMVPNCVAGDTIKVQAFQNSGGNLAYTTTVNQMYLQVHRIG